MLTALVSLSFAIPDEARGAAVGQWTIEAVEGAGSVRVTRKGKAYQGPEGSTLQPGDIVETGAGASTRIVDQGGTEVVIGRSSRYEVLAPKQGAQWGQLSLGHVRAKVQKAANASQSKIKFAIRTKSSIMGVRGTDFTVDVAKGGEAILHTLEGRVDAAKDEKSLLGGKGIPVPAGEMLRAALSGPLAQPVKFNREDFVGQLRGLQPEAGQLLQKNVKPPAELQKIRRPDLPPMPAALQNGIVPPPGGAIPGHPPVPVPGAPPQSLPGAQPGALPPKPPIPFQPPPKPMPPPQPPPMPGTTGL